MDSFKDLSGIGGTGGLKELFRIMGDGWTGLKKFLKLINGEQGRDVDI